MITFCTQDVTAYEGQCNRRVTVQGVERTLNERTKALSSGLVPLRRSLKRQRAPEPADRQAHHAPPRPLLRESRSRARDQFQAARAAHLAEGGAVQAEYRVVPLADDQEGGGLDAGQG